MTVYRCHCGKVHDSAKDPPCSQVMGIVAAPEPSGYVTGDGLRAWEEWHATAGPYRCGCDGKSVYSAMTQEVKDIITAALRRETEQGAEIERLEAQPWPCKACESEPDAPSPCPCNHAPCIHDRNAEIAALRARLAEAEKRAERVEQERDAMVGAAVKRAAEMATDAALGEVARQIGPSQVLKEAQSFGYAGADMLLKAPARGALDAAIELAREDGGVAADKQWNEELPTLLSKAREEGRRGVTEAAVHAISDRALASARSAAIAECARLAKAHRNREPTNKEIKLAHEIADAIEALGK